MYSNADAKDARKTIEYFEQVRDFFMRSKSSSTTTRLPVTIVGFRGPKDYKPYAPNESAAAYYLGDQNRDFIIMGDVGEENFPIATHEYMHLLVRHTGMKLPIWLGEGIADVYSSLTPYGGKIMIGDILKGRAFLLRDQKWMPLPKLFAVEHNSPEYNERNRTGILYAQSWLLTHMLMLGEGYAPQFAEFLDVIHTTQSSEKAFESVYRKTPADVEDDLRDYYRGRVRGALYDMKLAKMTAAGVEPATEIQVEVLLARITGMLRRYDEAASRLKQLASRNPGNPEIHEVLGHLYWQKQDKHKAREHLARAVQLNSPSWKTYWDFALLAQDAPADDKLVIEALQKALSMNPDLTDARLMLGYRYYASNQFGLASAALRQIKRVTPEIAPRFFLLLAHVSLRLNDREEAKKAAQQARKYAKESEEIRRSDELLAFLEQPARQTSAPVAGEAPHLPKEQLETLRGVLTELECLGGQAKLHIQATDRKLILLIRDPKRVYIKRAASEEQMLICGKVSKPLIVEYLPKEDASTGTAGEARMIEFADAAQ